MINEEAVIEWLKAKDIIKLSSQEEMARKELKTLSSIKPQEDIVPFDLDLFEAGLMCLSKDIVEVLDKIRAEIIDTGAYEQEVNGKTEFLKGINYCLGVIDKYKTESENKECDSPKCSSCIHKNEDVICYGCVDNDEYEQNREDCLAYNIIDYEGRDCSECSIFNKEE